ncbi:MAG: hypothetical protein ABIV51_12455 [Saprospiraceae bacterium]
MSENEYAAGVELLRRKDPGNAILSRLALVQNPLNEMYLKHEIKKIDPASIDVLENGTISDIQERMLFNDKRYLFAERAKLSNKFHDCTTNEERAEISSQIQEVQKQIKHINDKINSGDVSPEPENVPAFKMPETDLEVMMELKKKQNLITKHKSKLREMAALVNKPGMPDKIAKKEAHLSELKHHVQLLTARLPKAPVHD